MTINFYDSLAPYYKYIYEDWDKSVRDQANALDSIIKEFFREKRKLLDASCGIGTQTIGLAQLGYEVHASDLSSAALEIAKQEAEKRGLKINCRVADMRELSQVYDNKFELVLSADNSIPHLLTDGEISKAFEEFFKILQLGGGCIITVRDYQNINPEKQRYILKTRHVHEEGNQKIVIFDLWEFDGDYYDLNMYLIKDGGSQMPQTIALRSRYYCITTEKLEQIMREVGFQNVRTLHSRFYQPVIIGLK